MGESSAIAWTDHTFSPWWGCTRVSPGCERCYAERLATVRRKLPVWGVDAPRKEMSEAYWRAPFKWNRKAEAAGVRARVFCASMADVFETVPERNVHARVVMARVRSRLFPMIQATPWLDWLLLTKRPQNVESIAPGAWALDGWPPNVWLGVTVEDNDRRSRIDTLREIPAAVRFISYEPAVEGVDFRDHLEGIDWLIVGGESGAGARIFDIEWARQAIAAARTQGAAPFMKQLGSDPHDSRRTLIGGWSPGDPEPDTRVHAKGKGDDPSEWPEDLRVQEFPCPRS